MKLSLCYYHLKAWETLRKHWKDALPLSVIAMLPSLLSVLLPGLLPAYQPPDVPELYLLYLQLYLRQVPVLNWVLLVLGYLVVMVLTSIFRMGCYHYFVQITRGVDLGWKGVFSWLHRPGKAVWLHVRKAVQFFLWSLLLIFPGVIAAYSYLLAESYLADEPESSVGEVIKRSKSAMRGHKLDYLLVSLGYLPVLLVHYLISRWLGPVGAVLGCVLQALYMCWVYAAIAWFYRAVGEAGGLRRAYEDFIARRRKAGASPEQLKQLKLEQQKKLQKHKKKR